MALAAICRASCWSIELVLKRGMRSSATLDIRPVAGSTGGGASMTACRLECRFDMGMGRPRLKFRLRSSLYVLYDQTLPYCKRNLVPGDVGKIRIGLTSLVIFQAEPWGAVACSIPD